MKTSIESRKGVRQENQDYATYITNQGGQFLTILCDGMGGHQGGAVASKLCGQWLSQDFKESLSFENIDQAKSWFEKEILSLNERIYIRGSKDKDLLGMGTTLVACLFLKDTFLFANVGDSRAYVLKHGQVKQITSDHSFANELYLSGEISLSESKSHPKKHMLTRTIGQPREVEVDFFTYDVSSVDYILLCSDGLTNFICEEDIGTIIKKSGNVDEKTKELVNLAMDNQSTDNVTVLLIDIGSEKEVGK